LEGSIEKVDLPFEENTIDVILCLDVLEHLVDPWAVVSRLHTLLKPGGMLICSIPNVRNFRVVLPLLLLGRWRYREYGILDKTHLRFFTKKSAIALVGCSGLVVDMVRSTGLEKWSKDTIANLLSLTVFRSLFEYQYLIRAIKK
jgi:2-polyprenyl-3-methyl-5-hydroxy-6-metoxy-1,4-benzoquinol methylase